ncbi:MAG: hypothetical protein KDA85_16065, partial [Planctomycetaceae bacterium]|nr:hypothetical protein [Planctomycetaceae bacterium]
IEASCIAVLATATWAEIRKLPAWEDFDNRIADELIFEVLSERKPEWINDWAEAHVAHNAENWNVVRRLVRAGIATRSTSDAMISGMLACLDAYCLPTAESIDRLLLADPELLEVEVWRLFEVQRPNSLNFAVRDESRHSISSTLLKRQQHPGWLDAFLLLAREGKLSRERLLQESLISIEREFPDSMSRWFPRLHEALEPTADERRTFLPRYLSYLQSPNASTVTFALNVLSELEPTGLLDDRDVISQLGLVLFDKTKARAKQALKLLEQIEKRTPALKPDVAEAAITALSHNAADIQRAAWKLIEPIATQHSARLHNPIRTALDAVAASVRGAIDQWLTQTDPSRAESRTTSEVTTRNRHSPSQPAASGRTVDVGLKPVPETNVTVPSVKGCIDGVFAEPKPPLANQTILCDLLNQLESLPEPLVRAARLHELNAVIDNGRLSLPPVNLRSLDVPRIGQPVIPIQTVEELIDACAAAVESLESADEIERLLDGILRLCDQRPDDFELRTAALQRRVLSKLKSSGAGGGATFLGDSILADVNAVIWAWLTGEVSQQTIIREINIHGQNLRGSTAGGEAWIAFPPDEPSWLRMAFSERAKRIAERAANQQAMPLLSAPTHAGGWIDPVVLVRRLQQFGGQLTDVPTLDQALALLRLAFINRPAALQSLTSESGEFVDALRFALGEPRVTSGPTAAIWCAAARARSPWENDPVVEQLHPDLGPDTGPAATYRLEFYPAQEHPGKLTLTVQPRRVTREPQRWNHLPVGKLKDDFELQTPTPVDPNLMLSLHEGLPEFQYANSGPPMLRWAFTVWPANSTPLLARGLFHLKKNIDWKSRLWTNRVYLERLLNPDEPLTEVAALLLVIGLAAKEPGEVAVATDVAIHAIHDGRLIGSVLGPVLRGTLSTDLFRISRWAKALTEIARPSALHAEVVRSILASVLTGDLKSDFKDLAALLELYYELTLQTGAAIEEPTRAWLSGFSGSGKAAKVVRQLLKIDPAAPNPSAQEALQLAAQWRLERVQRWQQQ